MPAAPKTTVAQLFNLPKTLEIIESRALVGLQDAGEFTLGRAKQHAPVRELYGRQKGRRQSFSRSWKTIRTPERYQAFMSSKAKSRRMNVSKDSSESFLGERMMAEQSGGIRRGSKFMGRSGSFRGTRGSLFPVMRSKAGTVTGDFRSIGNFMRSGEAWRKQGTRPDELLVQRRGARYARTSSGSTPGGTDRVKRDIGRNKISSRGRYEVKKAVREKMGGAPVFALGKTTRIRSALFQGRVGGRLRGEIRLTPITHKGGVYWIYVESPTEYARHMEFGTRHNRPFPYLRPALYEARSVLVAEVRRRVGTKKWKVPFTGTSQLNKPFDYSRGAPEDKNTAIDFSDRGEEVPTGPSAPSVTLGEAYSSGGY